jgi:hypothetical protein
MASPIRPALPPDQGPASLILLVLLGLAACGGPPPLVLLPQPIPIGYDAHEVHDAALLDVDGDGSLEVVAATAAGLHVLRATGGGWVDQTPGTALDRVGPAQRAVPDGQDLLVECDGAVHRLAWSGIGSWAQGEQAPAAGLPDQQLSVEADLDGDGALDRAWIEGRTVHVALRDLTGVLRDVTTAVAADAMPLGGPGRCLQAGDLDGDGDTDLLAVGSRLVALINNGGVLEPDAPH